MANVLNTILLHFEDEEAAAAAASGSVKIEADEVRNTTVDSSGATVQKTSFQVTDPYFFLVYHTSDLELYDYKPCAGTLIAYDSVQRDREDFCVFTEIDSADDSTNKPSLSYIPASGITQDWFEEYSSTFNMAYGLQRDEDLSLKFTSGTAPCQVNLSYPVSFRSFEFRPPSDLTLDTTDDSDSVDIYMVLYFRSTE